MIKLLLSFILLFTLSSCSFGEKETVLGGWIGGEIINPTVNHIILTKNDQVIDTILLDSNNRFLYHIPKIEKGLYNFIHNEYQILYLEPGDSLMLRLNTIEFDESLAFTGKGAERNNFLIKMFLYNEEENQLMRPFYQLPVNDFLVKLDSMKALRYTVLNSFIERHKPCNPFYKVAESNILYDYYSKKDIYPYVYYGKANSDLFNDLPNDYYNYRKEIDYNSEALQSNYTYYRFMIRHFDHLAHETYASNSIYDEESLLHIKNKLNKINELVVLDNLKNNLLRSSVRRYIVTSNNPLHEKEVLSQFNELSTDESHKSEINKLSEASLLLMPGNQLPQILIVNINNDVAELVTVFKKPSVIYFWSLNSVNHYTNVHSKVKELKVKYPEFDFIALNTNDDRENWKRVIQRNGFDSKYEYRFKDCEKAKNLLVINSINKSMIVDQNGIIIDNHTNLFSSTFELKLLSFLNQ